MRASWRGTRKRGSWRWTAERQLALDSREAVGVGQQRGEQQAVDDGPGREQLALDSRESWRGTTDRGSQHRTPETVGDKIGSSEEDRLKMSAFEVLVEFSLVTHASDSPHMHIVLHTFLCSWLTPSFVRVCSFLLLFSPFPGSYSCVRKEMCVTPSNHLLITSRRKKWHG